MFIHSNCDYQQRYKNLLTTYRRLTYGDNAQQDKVWEFVNKLIDLLEDILDEHGFNSREETELPYLIAFEVNRLGERNNIDITIWLNNETAVKNSISRWKAIYASHLDNYVKLPLGHQHLGKPGHSALGQTL